MAMDDFSEVLFFQKKRKISGNLNFVYLNEVFFHQVVVVDVIGERKIFQQNQIRFRIQQLKFY